MATKKPSTAKKTTQKSGRGTVHDYRPGGNFKKATPPPLGEAFGDHWGKVSGDSLILPNGGALSFDFTKLTLSDYREMLSNYQIKASLEALNFILHQSAWTIECESEKIKDHVTENLSRIWTQLNFAMCQAHWAGYSPNILQWENNTGDKRIELAKVKDLLPETATINWKDVDGWAPPGEKPPKHQIYDGIREFGGRWPIPSENSLWYAYRAQNGDLSGTKMLQSAYVPYYFSNLIHLFNSRYLERFGEPAMVGRAPMGEQTDFGDGTEMDAGAFMLRQMNNLRNGAVAVLPNEKDLNGKDGEFEYKLEYIESQMRGADFERYLTRLDEEMSLALFTPLLLMRTGDSGSYNQSSTHMQMFLWGLNSINGDRKLYIDKFIINRMVDFNFGPKAPRARINFRKMGNDNSELVRTVATQMVNGKIAKVDLRELSDAAGLRFLEMTEEEALAAAGRESGGAQPEAEPETDDPGVGKSNDPDPAGNPNNPDPGAGKRKRTKKGIPSDTA